jgi:hypothetical protein
MYHGCDNVPAGLACRTVIALVPELAISVLPSPEPSLVLDVIAGKEYLKRRRRLQLHMVH